jgi:primosomal protein N' (replication factor Y)
MEPVIGGRVLVPFRREQMQGIVVHIHKSADRDNLKHVLRVLDTGPVLSAEQMQLGVWIAEYYLAPLGEVLRSMLPLQAEVRQQNVYCITELGQRIVSAPTQQTLTGTEGTVGEQAVLAYLANGAPVDATMLRKKTAAKPEVLMRLLQKRWITRVSIAEARTVRRSVRVAVLLEGVRLPKLNDNQQLLLAELAGAQGTLPLNELARLPVPRTTLGTLVRRGLVRIEEVPAASPFIGTAALLSEAHGTFTLNTAQTDTVLQIAASVHTGKFHVFLLHGVTGSGKTAVYLAAMQSVAGPGDWPDPRHGGAVAVRLWRQGGPVALVALAHRARGAVAPHPQWRCASGGRYTLSGLCPASKSGPGNCR